MTAPVKPVDAWAVVGPDADIAYALMKDTEDWAIDAFLKYHGVKKWGVFARRGYRCVRVTVAVKEGE